MEDGVHVLYVLLGDRLKETGGDFPDQSHVLIFEVQLEIKNIIECFDVNVVVGRMDHVDELLPD